MLTMILMRCRNRTARSRSSTRSLAWRILISGTNFPSPAKRSSKMTSRSRYYNNTPYSGLETHILNSYTNPMVQLLHYTHPIRQLAKSHITTDCARENCLFCELGFVNRMLEDAHGVNCQSSNFCKTVGVLAHGVNLIEIVDYGRESANMNHAHMIQSFHRFLVDNLTSEGNAYPQNPWLIPPTTTSSTDPAPAPITQLLGIDAKNVIICTNCHAIREKEQMLHLVDLAYPRKVGFRVVTVYTEMLKICT